MVWFAQRLRTTSNAIMERYYLCHICGVEADTECDSCRKFVCYEHRNADWSDADICDECDAGLEACGAKAECAEMEDVNE